ncbi:MAG: S41 family peptidase [Flavobacteriaceae bacterium]|nr:S41 family peptidase [Flavobacteriaceae bacterium]
MKNKSLLSKNLRSLTQIFAVLLFAFGIVSCEKSEESVSANLQQNDFVWKGLNLWYFWQADVPNLADNRFGSDSDYTNYLKSYDSPKTLFESLLFKSSNDEDRFSDISENYKDLVNSLSGVSKNNGLDFRLYRINKGAELYGEVRYIMKDSDAASKDIQRGEIFTTVDGTPLTDSNYQNLLFGSKDTYTLGMADYNNGNPTSNGKEVSLTKIANFQENPILLQKVIESGGKKIGYLMYNQFVSSYNKELNDVFGSFKTAGVTDLVLDFRYNPGGSVNTSRLLSSMVHTTNTSKLYIKQRWNSKIQSQLPSEQLEDYFANTIDGTTALNSLNLNKVYILITNGSASASELVINGLNPHMDVILIGNTSRGKNEFSITLVDDKENSFIYNKNRESAINPQNNWAMQPLVGRNENSAGFSSYTSGFTPDIVFEETRGNLGILGENNEPFLAKALAVINGTNVIAAPTAKSIETPKDIELSNSKDFSPLHYKMILDKEIRIENPLF